MILLIDNYDSFSYNVYQLLGTVQPDIRVVRNDEVTLEDIDRMQPEAIVLSPGPGRPNQAGICPSVIRTFYQKYPILGICLGHQAICEAFGATVSYAGRLMHGKTSPVKLEMDPLFAGLEQEMTVARYHSLVALPETIPDTLKVLARTEEGEIMAVRHQFYPVYGLQFHPESVLTPQGDVLIRNFWNIRTSQMELFMKN